MSWSTSVMDTFKRLNATRMSVSTDATRFETSSVFSDADPGSWGCAGELRNWLAYVCASKSSRRNTAWSA